MGQDATRWPLADPAFPVPRLQPGCGRLPGPEACDRVEQVGVVVLAAAEVLAPQPQPQLAGEHPRPIPEPRRVDRLAEIQALVQDGAGDLGVVGSRSGG